MKLHLYNSLSNKLELFTPIDPDNVTLYVCGPTVYASPHIGNARPIIIFDVLYRALQKLYKKVTYVRNITDIDDKINNKSRLLGISIRELTDGVIKEFHKSIKLLNALFPTIEPRATDHMPEILGIIDTLMENGYAYEAQGHVLFRVKKLNNYGILSKRDTDDLIAGNRIEVAPYKEDNMDFVLWKPSDEHTPAWPSKHGRGRPGWHVECSAMSNKYLGNKFDIHAGGQDLMFPHHENEIAQNFGAFGCLMANYWVHNSMLLVDGQKMSKSLGNIISLSDMLEIHDGELIRYILLSTHYQKALNWTDTAVHQAKQALNRLYGALKLATETVEAPPVENKILNALCNNLNTPLALSELHEIADIIYKSTSQAEINKYCAILQEQSQTLGILSKTPQEWFTQKISISEDLILKMIEERALAKKSKNFQLADLIRSDLLKMNIQIEDTKDGTIWRSI